MVECTATNKKARKKREAETSLFSLALYNTQRSYSTKLSLGTLSIPVGDYFDFTVRSPSAAAYRTGHLLPEQQG